MYISTMFDVKFKSKKNEAIFDDAYILKNIF